MAVIPAYKETKTVNADGSVTSTANRPQDGTIGSGKNSDGSTMRNKVSTPGAKTPSNVDFNDYRTQTATLNDISQKYGFDFSRDYANRQAEAEAQALRNANAEAGRKNTANNQLNLQNIDNNVMGAAEGLDRNYFQKYMEQAQNQSNKGLNSGIAADQNLRLNMSRQAEMGDVYRDANLGRMEEGQRFSLEDVALAENMGLINQQALAREDSLFNERLQMGFDNAMTLTGVEQAQNLAMMNAALQQREQNIGNNQFNANLGWDQAQFNNVSATDQQQFDWDQYMFDNISATDQKNFDWEEFMFNNVSATDQQKQDFERFMFNNVSATDKQRQDFEKYVFENMSAAEKEAARQANAQLTQQQYEFNNMSATEKANYKLAQDQLAQEKAQFKTDDEWRRYVYNNMSATEKAQLDAQITQFGETMAWSKYELDYTSQNALAIAEAQYAIPGGASGDPLAGIP